MTGLTLPGKLDEPGCICGRLISLKPQRGPEASRRRSLQVLVSLDRSLQDLAARAKAEPGKLSYGHAGPASVPHLSVAAVEKAQGLAFNA